MIVDLYRLQVFLRLRVWLGFLLLAFPAFAPLTTEAASPHLEFLTPKLQDSPTLEPGKPIERELKAGETHMYALALVAGQYVRVDVEQRGIRVVLTLLAPNREKIFEFTAIQTSGLGRQIACLVAEQTGRYYVQLRAGYSEDPPAPYVVQSSQLREATARDQARFAAQKMYGQLQLNSLPRPTSLNAKQDSLRKLEAALLISQQIEDQEMEAMLLHEMGWRYSFDLANELKAIDCFGRALQLRRTLGHRYDQAAELSALGYSHYMLGKVEQARDYYQQSRPIFSEVGDRVSEGNVLFRLGLSYIRESPKNTINYYLQAEPLLRGVGGETETQLQYEMALAWLFLGEPQNAFAASHKALSIAEQLAWKGMKGNALLNLSRTHQAVGDYQKALDTIYQALALFKAIGYPEAESRAVYTLGLQYLELGETQRGLDFHLESVQLHQRIAYEARGLRSQGELVSAYYQLGQYQTARDYALSILPLTRKYQDKISEGRVLQGLGQAYQALGEAQKSGDCFAQAAALFREMQFPAGEAQALQSSGQAYASQRNFPKALELYRQALSLAQKINNPLVETQSLTGLARAEQALGKLAAARANLEAALKIIESVRSRVVSPALRASFLATRRSTYESYLALLMEQHQQHPTAGHAVQALQISERARARSLVEILTEASAEIRAGVDPVLLNRERELRQKLSAKATGQNRAASQTEEQAASFSQEISALTAELEQVDSQIRAASPRYAALTQPQLLTLSEVQKEVVTDANTILLEYALGEEKSWLWAVTSTGMQSYELPKRAEIEAAARRVYELLTARKQRSKFEEDAERRARIQKADAEFPQAAAALSQMILAPVAAQLGTKRLLIVADGALQYVPFAALPEPEFRVSSAAFRGSSRVPENSKLKTRNSKPLIANHEIVSLPSASTLAVLRRELAGRKPAPKAIAVIADPVFEKTDVRLTNASAQATPVNQAATRGEWWQSELERSARDVGAAGERAGFARLPATREEAQAAVKFAPTGSSFTALDFAANQTTATSEELSQYRYVHFATHGVMNNEHPELSGLVLSLLDEKGNDTDGFLRLVEIYNLKLPAEMVVLSACRTGLGKEVQGEGLMSLTRGFMYTGAARVLVSLWDVNDASTAALMTRMYQGILQDKLSPAAALRKAQNALRQEAQWAAPYHWASFTIHGEPR